ncbi:MULTISPECIES: WhiB family transcriptional regulator [Rhodococcus]|uniref:WhiB family transcriptional regulator n=1 Tax=Rhodococcus TaxID=1827 RepID=UPI0002720244|nr:MULTISPECIES: WhiB family transcriptional regulator [Rhodococcus]EJJ02215.1 transcription factor WhiB family protein [Rhodococcus sp. JVH1]
MLPARTPSTPTHQVLSGPEGWRDSAACRGIEPSMFFSPDNERGIARSHRESRARQICQDCPVLTQCREHALTTGEPYGIWGGMTENDRKRHTNRARRREHRPLAPRHATPATADALHLSSAR